MVSTFGILLCLLFNLVQSLEYNSFDDSIKFEVSWPGKLTSSEDQLERQEFQFLTTFDNEAYKCLLPKRPSLDESDGETSEALTPAVLLAPALNSKDCIFLVDGFWTYELCYGQQLRQFHEEKQQEAKTLEYILGVFGKSEDQSGSTTASPPTWLYLNKEYPYYKISLTNGSPCDLLGNTGRATKLMFICDSEQGDVPSLIQVKESSTCQYEAVVVTNQLCQNRAYRVKVSPVHSIQCHPVKSSPNKPVRLHEHELSVSEFTEDTSSTDNQQLRMNFQKDTLPRQQVPQDETFVKNFLSGDSCIIGSFTTWWQYELCFKGHVRQFHREGGVVMQSITLGVWDEMAHNVWFSKMGKSKQSKNHVTNLYVNGDVCDVTGQPRQVRVKFKCAKKFKSVTAISISLEEPTPCNYLLTVEAGFFCNLLRSLDNNGVFLPSTSSSGSSSSISSP